MVPRLSDTVDDSRGRSYAPGVRSVITGLCLIGVSLLLIWALDLNPSDGKWGVGLAGIPGIIGGWMIWQPVRDVLWGTDDD